MYKEIMGAIEKQKGLLYKRKPRERVFTCTLNFYYHYAMKYYGGILCYITDKGWYIKNGVIVDMELIK